MTKFTILAVALAAAAVSPAPIAFAQTLAPIESGTIDLGTTRGSAFYMVEPDGYHLVATLFSGGANTPVRFNAVLSDGQSASVSIPGPAGTQAREVQFSRNADRLEVRETPVVDSPTQ